MSYPEDYTEQQGPVVSFLDYPEPPHGSVAIDGDGVAWQRQWDTHDWYAACSWMTPMTWDALKSEFGIIHVFPRSSVIAYQAADITARMNGGAA